MGAPLRSRAMALSTPSLAEARPGPSPDGPVPSRPGMCHTPFVTNRLFTRPRPSAHARAGYSPSSIAAYPIASPAATLMAFTRTNSTLDSATRPHAVTVLHHRRREQDGERRTPPGKGSRTPGADRAPEHPDGNHHGHARAVSVRTTAPAGAAAGDPLRSRQAPRGSSRSPQPVLAHDVVGCWRRSHSGATATNPASGTPTATSSPRSHVGASPAGTPTPRAAANASGTPAAARRPRDQTRRGRDQPTDEGTPPHRRDRRGPRRNRLPGSSPSRRPCRPPRPPGGGTGRAWRTAWRTAGKSASMTNASSRRPRSCLPPALPATPRRACRAPRSWTPEAPGHRANPNGRRRPPVCCRRCRTRPRVATFVLDQEHHRRTNPVTVRAFSNSDTTTGRLLSGVFRQRCTGLLSICS